MMSIFDKVILSLFLFIGAIFFLICTQGPFRWVQSEMVDQGVWWSLNLPEQEALHSGFRGSDWKKPLDSFSPFVDGIFRLRQVSYYSEMICFKIAQFFGRSLFFNDSLCIIHGLNTILLMVLVCRLSSLWAAIASGVFFLNMGVSLATVIFPFRNAKLLAVTFFLLAWVIAVIPRRTFRDAGVMRSALFFGCILLGLFTDEAFFFYTLLLFFILYVEDRSLIWSSKVRYWVLGTFFTAGVLAVIAWIMAWQLRGGNERSYGDLFKYIGQLSSSLEPWRDICISFGLYFLPRQFGYWDFSLLGGVAFVSFLGMLSCMTYPKGRFRTILLGMGVLFAIKTIFLPHNSGMHAGIMPEGTVFPSLLFFSYYYSYGEGALLAIFCGILWKEIANDQYKKVGLFVCILIISSSTAFHLKDGPVDALNFHGWNDKGYQQLAARIVGIRKLIDPRAGVLYVSIPFYAFQEVKDKWGPNGLEIPLLYVRDEESGNIIFSGYGARQIDPLGRELSGADRFYDVGTDQLVNLKDLKANNQKIFEIPEHISASGPVRKKVVIDKGTRRIVFFIRGRVKVRLSTNLGVFEHIQYYGISYQLFEVDNLTGFDGVLDMEFDEIDPKGVFLIGPLIIQE